MSSCRERLARTAWLVLLLLAPAAATAFEGIGRAATASEIAAWDIDVRPDFKGLPVGSGTVARGQQVWEAQCASCHGVFGESNEVFQPLVGGTTAEDIRTGRVARLNDAAFPGRTTMMKLSSVSTLWDYIRRAMPWHAPKTLTVEEVYATTAYILHLGGVVPEDFVLSNANIAQVQARLPNRDGMTLDHALWPGRTLTPAGRKPDVAARACMRDCRSEPKVASQLPAHARDAHGNLAEQNRRVGPVRGVATVASTGVVAPGGAAALAVPDLLAKHTCTACHDMAGARVGPAFRDIARRYSSHPDAAAHLAGRIRAGGSGAWGTVPMPPQNLPDAELAAIARWLKDGAQ